MRCADNQGLPPALLGELRGTRVHWYHWPPSSSHATEVESLLNRSRWGRRPLHESLWRGWESRAAGPPCAQKKARRGAGSCFPEVEHSEGDLHGSACLQGSSKEAHRARLAAEARTAAAGRDGNSRATGGWAGGDGPSGHRCTSPHGCILRQGCNSSRARGQGTAKGSCRFRLGEPATLWITASADLQGRKTEKPSTALMYSKKEKHEGNENGLCPMNHCCFLPLAPVSCQLLLFGNRRCPPLGTRLLSALPLSPSQRSPSAGLAPGPPASPQGEQAQRLPSLHHCSLTNSLPLARGHRLTHLSPGHLPSPSTLYSPCQWGLSMLPRKEDALRHEWDVSLQTWPLQQQRGHLMGAAQNRSEGRDESFVPALESVFPPPAPRYNC